MPLQTNFNWILYLRENKPLELHENVLEYIVSENITEQSKEEFDLPQLIQEIYYVIQLSTAGIHEEDKLSLIDSVYDYIRIFHSRIIELFQTKQEELNDGSQLDEEHYYRLLDLYGFQYPRYIESELSEPFKTRYAAYRIFNKLPNHNRRLIAVRDIIASPSSFEEFWNIGMESLCKMQKDIHFLNVDELETLLSKLTENNKIFKKRYLRESGGCFSLTRVKKNSVYEDVLCFSGQKFSQLNNVIDTIADSGSFTNPTVVKDSLNVRYYICPEKYVTFAEAKQTHEFTENRMFTCCERKTIAEYDWKDVDSYTMTTKYEPCELCQWPVYVHSKEYGGKIIFGRRNEPLKKKAIFDSIAKNIYKEIHGSPYFCDCLIKP